jgi:hypothetical protein
MDIDLETLNNPIKSRQIIQNLTKECKNYKAITIEFSVTDTSYGLKAYGIRPETLDETIQRTSTETYTSINQRKADINEYYRLKEKLHIYP